MQHGNSVRSLARATGFGVVLTLTSLALATSAVAADAGTQAPVVNGAGQVHITLTGDNGGTCAADFSTAKAGPVTFTVTNKTATSISEVELLSHNRILGEKENLAPGLPAGGFTVTLDGGQYKIYCPGAGEPMQEFTVVGELAERPGSDIGDLLKEGTKGYAHYVNTQVSAMVTAVERLKKAIDAGDLAKAKTLYPKARPFYERVESDIEGFVLPGYKLTDNHGSLDYLIDMRASSLDPAVGWHGFHAIERDLFKNGKITDETKQQAADLLKNVKRLDKIAPTLTYRPEDLANGAAALLEEVMTGKITGEEEAFSHYDLVDFAGNVEGAQQAFAYLKPGLAKIDPALTKTVSEQFANINKLLDSYRDANEPGGYVLYTPELRKTDAVKLSKAVQALQEPLSRIAEKVATAG